MELSCGGCKRVLPRAAFISIFAQGDEQIDSYFFCPACDAYTREVYYDHFLGDSDISVGHPISRKAGDEMVALIARCPDPTRKMCGCPAHLEYEAKRP